jgi:UDP-glucose 4-epimerase
LKARKILVTGATGYLGRQVTHALSSRGAEVVAVSRSGRVPSLPFASAPQSTTVRGVCADLEQDSAVAALSGELGPGVAVVHLAGSAPSADRARGEHQRHLELDVLGTLRLLDAVRESGGASVVVFVSTADVYAVTPDGSAVTELSPTGAISDFAVSKLAGEDHLQAFGEEARVRVVALRVPRLYGPEEATTGATRELLSAVLGGRALQVSAAAVVRDRLYVSDAAFAIECALDSSSAGVYNVSDGAPGSPLSAAKVAMELSGSNGEHRVSDEGASRPGPLLNIEKARRELGFQPRVTLAQGLRSELDWLRSLPAGA